jgi:hypothetical protein
MHKCVSTFAHAWQYATILSLVHAVASLRTKTSGEKGTNYKEAAAAL